jgi:hypothetical protein
MTCTPRKGIRQVSGEADFESYSGGTSVNEAVAEAINGLDLTGSISFKYSRHDFQPSSSESVNLQVQLGGSKPYRVGKGDTPSTFVVISDILFQKLIKMDKARLSQVIQEAHKMSYNTQSKVELV